VGNSVRIDFNNAQGNLDLEVYDEAQNLVGRSATRGNTEQVSLNGLPAGTYLARVFAADGKRNPEYDLDINPGTAPVPGWFDDFLQDAGVRQVAKQRFDADGDRILRGGLLDIFTQVALDNVVSTVEFADLQTIQQNHSLLRMPEHVKILGDKIVSGHVTNARYQGAPLGNLSPGNTGEFLRRLLNKHFFGQDRPSAVIVRDQRTVVYEYEYASAGRLFIQEPRYQHIRQGSLADCYLLAGIGGVAFRSPQMIRDVFVDNLDGTFAVRFYLDGVADYVTVDRFLPVDSNDKLVFASSSVLVNSPDLELWPVLLEKAYAQENESGRLARTKKENSYQSIEYGYPGLVVTQVTNKPHNNLAGAQRFNRMAASFVADDVVVLGSRPEKRAREILPFGVIASHAYIMVGYNAAARAAVLYNPWGVQHPPALTARRFNQVFSLVQRAALGGGISQGEARQKTEIVSAAALAVFEHDRDSTLFHWQAW
jgi:hypothetical protein